MLSALVSMIRWLDGYPINWINLSSIQCVKVRNFAPSRWDALKTAGANQMSSCFVLNSCHRTNDLLWISAHAWKTKHVAVTTHILYKREEKMGERVVNYLGFNTPAMAILHGNKSFWVISLEGIMNWLIIHTVSVHYPHGVSRCTVNRALFLSEILVPLGKWNEILHNHDLYLAAQEIQASCLTGPGAHILLCR